MILTHSYKKLFSKSASWIIAGAIFVLLPSTCDGISVTEIDFFGSELNDDELLLFTSRARSIVSLNLGYTNITDISLARLSGQVELQELRLSKTRISHVGLRTLDRLPKLAKLDVSDIEIGDKGIKALAKIKSMESLNLSRTKISNRAMRYLTKLTKLQKLTLSDNAIGDGKLVHLEKMTALKELDLAGTDILDSDLRSLRFAKLTWINLAHTKITDDGVEHVSQIRELEYLSLGGCFRVTETGILKLAAMPNLKTVSFPATGVSLAGRKTIEERMKGKVLLY